MYENLYPYKPSLALALLAVTVFGVLTFLHTYQTLRCKTWYFLAFLVGGYCKSAFPASGQWSTDRM